MVLFPIEACNFEEKWESSSNNWREAPIRGLEANRQSMEVLAFASLLDFVDREDDKIREFESKASYKELALLELNTMKIKAEQERQRNDPTANHDHA